MPRGDRGRQCPVSGWLPKQATTNPDQEAWFLSSVSNVRGLTYNDKCEYRVDREPALKLCVTADTRPRRDEPD